MKYLTLILSIFSLFVFTVQATIEYDFKIAGIDKVYASLRYLPGLLSQGELSDKDKHILFKLGEEAIDLDSGDVEQIRSYLLILRKLSIVGDVSEEFQIIREGVILTPVNHLGYLKTFLPKYIQELYAYLYCVDDERICVYRLKEEAPRIIVHPKYTVFIAVDRDWWSLEADIHEGKDPEAVDRFRTSIKRLKVLKPILETKFQFIDKTIGRYSRDNVHWRHIINKTFEQEDLLDRFRAAKAVYQLVMDVYDERIDMYSEPLFYFHLSPDLLYSVGGKDDFKFYYTFSNIKY